MEEQLITKQDTRLQVPNNPTIPYIEGDGIGPDIWSASVSIFNAAIEKAYAGSKHITWKEVFAGEKARTQIGEWLPQETLDAFKKYLVGIKGPLTTPVGGGMRSLNVTLRQVLDLYACVRPVKHFTNVPAPVKDPDAVDMVIFRENTEDIYAGIEFAQGSAEHKKFSELFAKEFPEQFAKVRFPSTAGYGIKPISQEGTTRLVKSAIDYALAHGKKSVTLVHKGNIMKFTEGAFKAWGYDTAKTVFGAQELDGGPWLVISKNGQEVIIKDVIADAFLQQILLRPKEYDVVATLNLNGDYISDALAAQVGGIGIAPGANINYESGVALFEATHGTAPKYAGLDKVNPCSVVLSGVMLLEYIGWQEAADVIVDALEKTFAQKIVTYDFARLMDDAQEVKTSEFADAVIKNMN